jgi:hypothetical protein
MDAVALPECETEAVNTQRPWRKYALRTAIWLLIAAIVSISIVLGLRIRYWTFQTADPVRFQDDIRRATFWGLLASGPEGYLNQYEKMDPEVQEWKDSRWTPWLDYSPLRLLVDRQWGVWQRAHHPPDPNVPLMDAWQRPYWFSAPILQFNTLLEGFASILAFFLTRHWVIRGSGGTRRGHFHGVWQGLVAALLLWFSPDMIINSHAWPQWDTWIVPWYLLGVLLASLDWWFAAGVAILIGANFKGQMFTIMPIFVIWPLAQGRVGAALRWLSGALFCYAVITSGWLISYLQPDLLLAAQKKEVLYSVTQFPQDLFAIPRIFDVPAAIWIFGMLLFVAAVPWLMRTFTPPPLAAPATRWKTLLHSQSTWIAVGITLMIAMVFWPWVLPKNHSNWYGGLIAGGAAAASAMLFPRRSQGYVLAAIAGGGLFACVWLFHGSLCWWHCAVRYGSAHWPYLFIGPTSNIPAIFQLRFGWAQSVDQIAFTLPAIPGHWWNFITTRSWWPAADVDITAKVLFNAIYGVLLLISGIAIGVQTRRNDRRALVAFVTPWIMFFLFPVQVQERYLLWAVGAAACCIGNSVGTALLGIVLSLFSLMMPMKILIDIGSSDLDRFGENLSKSMPWLFSPQAGHTIAQYLDGTQPDIAYGMLVIGLVFLYLSVTPSRRTKIAGAIPSRSRINSPASASVSPPAASTADEPASAHHPDPAHPTDNEPPGFPCAYTLPS